MCSLVFSQGESSTDEVIVTGQRVSYSLENSAINVEVIDSKEIEKMAIQSISDILELSSGLDVRNRGKSGTQSDISIRGGHFNQTLIMLDGVPISDPHTGHHSMNLTINKEVIDRIEIIKGGGSKSAGINSFAGVVNIITKREVENKVSVDLQGGEFGFYNMGLTLTNKYNNLNSIFYVNKEGSNGFTTNTDHQTFTAGLKSSYLFDNSNYLSLDLSLADRQFGANSFYSASFPNQFETTKTLNTSIKGKFGDKLVFTPSVYYRTNYDRFELYRSFNGAADWYQDHNYHLSGILGTNGNLSYKSNIGVSSFGYEVRRENIYSTVLGENLNTTVDNFIDDTDFTKQKDRLNTTFFLENAYSNDKIVLNTGLSVFNNSDFGTYFNPGVDFAYKINSQNKVLINLNRSVRIPTFTEIYYTGPTNIGNINLKPEVANNYEIGYNYFNDKIRFNSGVFVRQGENLIDWNRPNDTTVWQTNNLTDINFYGIEGDFTYNINLDIDNIKIHTIKIGGLVMQSDMKESGFDSYYVLDHLNYKFNLLVIFKIFNKLDITYDMSYQKRNGNFQLVTGGSQVMSEYDAFLMSNIKLNYNLKELTKQDIDFYVDVTNLFDESYFDLANVPVAGRWATVGFRYGLGY